MDAFVIGDRCTSRGGLRIWTWLVIMTLWVTSGELVMAQLPGQMPDGDGNVDDRSQEEGRRPMEVLVGVDTPNWQWYLDNDVQGEVSGNRTVPWQAWARTHSLLPTDTLIFGNITSKKDPAKIYVYVVYDVPKDKNVSCDLLRNETKIGINATGSSVMYQYPSDRLPLKGEVELAFLSANLTYCEEGLRFHITFQPPLEPTHQSRHQSVTGWIIGVSIGSAVVVIAVAIALAYIARNGSYWNTGKAAQRRIHTDSSFVSASLSFQVADDHFLDMEWPCDGGPRRFSFKELKAATKCFSSSQVLGEGGFGTVYKGSLRSWPGHPIVAIKRLSQCARQGAREFMAEVNTIAQLRHRNLVHLLGWCDENENELILVSEYMCNGDLDDLIFGTLAFGEARAEWKPLPWKCRYNIFCGVARALVYLHEEWTQRVIHRDVKTSNIMLDARFNARLGDFGLARLSAHSQAPRTTLVAGTIGYLAPEFNLTGRATDRTDVYAFGVVVLEVSCARRPLTPDCILVDWVWELHRDEKLLDAIDPNLAEKSPADEEEMKRALRLGLLCCHPDPQARPSTRLVLNILTGDAPLPALPRSRPVAYFAESE